MADVAILLPTLHPGGAEKVMLNLSRAFVERGISVDMVLGQAVGEFLPLLDERVRVIDLGAPRVLQALPALVRYLRREPARSLLSSLPHLNLAAILARIWSGNRSRLVIVEHGVASMLKANRTRGWERFFPLAMRLLYPRADAVVAVSQDGARRLAGVTGLRLEKITVIHNPVDLPDILEKAVLPLEHPWFTPDGADVIVAAGRLTAAKDFPTLLHAFALLRARRPARLLILGEGDLRPELEALVVRLGLQDFVRFVGFQKNPFAFISRAALFVLSSAWEGFGNVLVEALACATQVVSTDCPGGPAEILDGGRYGRLVPVGDPPAMAIAMQDALEHPLPLELLRGRARAFSVEIAVEKYLTVLGLNE